LTQPTIYLAGNDLNSAMANTVADHSEEVVIVKLCNKDTVLLAVYFS